MNIFSTVTMMAAVKQDVGATSYLRDRYFSNVKTFDTKKIALDVVSGKRSVAPFVHPKIGGKAVESKGYSTKVFEAPEVSPLTVTTAEDLLFRIAGEQIAGALSPEERAAIKLAEDLTKLDEMITRREQLMCSEALFKGQVTVKGDGYDQVIKYWDDQDKPYLELVGDAVWGTEKSEPFEDLRNARRDIIKNSGVTPREVLMGSKALDAFLITMRSKKMELDYSAVKMGVIEPRDLPNGVTYWGRLLDSQLDIYTYEEYVLDENDKEIPLVPEDLILIGSPEVPTTMAYGVITLMKGSGDNAAPEFFAERRVPDSWTQRANPSGRIVQVKAAPLPIINQVKGFKVLKVLK